MLARAKQIKAKTNADNTFFVKSQITRIEVEDSMADCIISNCVINLVPEDEKQSVFNEMYRLLKPGGRVSVSDILLKKDLPDELRNDVALYVGCISGASRVDQYEQYLKVAKFKGECSQRYAQLNEKQQLIRPDTMIIPDDSDLNVYKTANKDGAEAGCCGPSSSGKSSCSSKKAPANKAASVENADLNEWAGSFKIYAVKAA